MAAKTSGIYYNIFDISLEMQQFTHKTPLFGSPIPLLAISLTYLIFVLKLGPFLMRNREPYNMKYFMLVYNAIQVCYNGFLVHCAIKFLYIERSYDFWCMDSLRLDHPLKHWELILTQLFYYNKVLDLTDTIIFVLRKNFRQITLLHVYHHLMMINFGYLIIHFYGLAAHSSIMASFNAAVHTFMYAYYFACVVRPELKNNLRYKKCITILQIVQFWIICMHSLISLATPNCSYPKLLMLLHLLQAIIMLFMFSNFYLNTYVKPGLMSTKVLPPTEFNIGNIMQRKYQ